MKEILRNDWKEYLEPEFEKEYYQRLRAFLATEYRTKTIYPDMHDIFNALHYTSYEELKVVILGQDPYHGPGQAHGLAFSVKPGISVPPSLVNMYKELQDDVGCDIPDHGYLKKWADQGVLMLNTVLTVREGEAHSHKDRGWEVFTNRVIEVVNEKESPVVFLLWGRPAQEKAVFITNPLHRIIRSAHPSPLSAYRGFFGSKPFTKTNEILRRNNLTEIDWCL